MYNKAVNFIGFEQYLHEEIAQWQRGCDDSMADNVVDIISNLSENDYEYYKDGYVEYAQTYASNCVRKWFEDNTNY